MASKVFRAFFLSVSVSACARGATRIEPEPQPAELPSTAPSASASSRTFWTIVPSSQSFRYRSTTKAIIDLNDSSTVFRDSLTTSSAFSLSVTRDQRALSYNAIVEAFSVQACSRFGSLAPTQFPISISGRLEGNRFSSEANSDCSAQASIVAPAIQRLVSALPVQLRKDQTWTDSTSSNVCSGAIPLNLSTVRTYRVLGEAETRGIPAIRLSREDRTTSQGEGSEGQHRVQIETNGTGKGELLINRTTGSLIESSSMSVVTLTIKASGRVQRFTQTSRELVVQQ